MDPRNVSLWVRGCAVLAGALFLPTQGCSVSGDAAAQGTGDAGSNPDGGTDEPPPGLSEADARAVCTTLQTARCARLERCAPLVLSVQYASREECVSEGTEGCIPVLRLPGTSITQAQATACAGAQNGAACDKLTLDLSECSTPGALENGKPCLSHDQCQSEQCTFTGSGCGTCAPPLPKTKPASCSAQADCPAYSVCSSGQCKDVGKAKGQDCAAGDECISSLGLTCDNDFGTCVEVTGLATASQPCRVDAANTMIACDDGLCNESTTPAVCIPRAKIGGDCDQEAGPICDYDCDATTKKCVVRALDYSICTAR